MVLSGANYKQLFWFETQFPSFMLKSAIFRNKNCSPNRNGVGGTALLCAKPPHTPFLPLHPQPAMLGQVGQEG